MGKLLLFFVDVPDLTVSLTCKAWWEIWRGKGKAKLRTRFAIGESTKGGHRWLKLTTDHDLAPSYNPIYMILPKSDVRIHSSAYSTNSKIYVAVQRHEADLRQAICIHTSASTKLKRRRNWITRWRHLRGWWVVSATNRWVEPHQRRYLWEDWTTSLQGFCGATSILAVFRFMLTQPSTHSHFGFSILFG